MVLLVVLLFLAGYTIAALRAARRGTASLWSTAVAAVLVPAIAAAAFGRDQGEPSASRLVAFALAFTGPVVLGTTLALSLVQNTRLAAWSVLIAVLGGSVGFVVGFIFIVYVVRVW